MTPSVFPVICGALFAVFWSDGGGTWRVELGASEGIDPALVPVLPPVLGATPPPLGAVAAGAGLLEVEWLLPPLNALGEMMA